MSAVLAEAIQRVLEECSRETTKPEAECAGALKSVVDSLDDASDAVELGARQLVVELLTWGQPNVVLGRLVGILIEYAAIDPKSGRVPYHVIEDVLDGSSEGECEGRWQLLVEDKQAQLTQSELFRRGKFVVLRFCNGLLKRLSRPRNAELCGRVLFFLARAFPLSERSAVNVKGDHSDIVTHVEDDETQFDTTADFQEYTSFWSVQRWLANPTLALNSSEECEMMFSAADSCLQTLQNSASDAVENPDPSVELLTGRYLTDPHLLPVQLKDAIFRTQVLTQCYLMFDHFRHELSDEDAKRRCLELSKRALRLVQISCPPHGEQHAKFIQHLAERERIWVKWKKDGCPPLEKPPLEHPPKKTEHNPWDVPTPEELRRKEEELQKEREKTKPPDFSDMEELAKACAKLKASVPTLEEHLKAWEEADDPENGIEEQFHPKNDEVYCWRARRLIVQQRPEFLLDMPDGDISIAVRKLQAERRGEEHTVVKANKLPDLPAPPPPPPPPDNMDAEPAPGTADPTPPPPKTTKRPISEEDEAATTTSTKKAKTSATAPPKRKANPAPAPAADVKPPPPPPRAPKQPDVPAPASRTEHSHKEVSLKKIDTSTRATAKPQQQQSRKEGFEVRIKPEVALRKEQQHPDSRSASDVRKEGTAASDPLRPSPRTGGSRESPADARVSTAARKESTAPDTSRPLRKEGTAPDTSRPLRKESTAPDTSRTLRKESSAPDTSRPLRKESTVPDSSRPLRKEGSSPPDASRPLRKEGTAPPDASRLQRKEGTASDASRPQRKEGTASDASRPQRKEGTASDASRPQRKEGTAPDASRPQRKEGTAPDTSRPQRKEGTAPDASRPQRKEGTAPDAPRPPRKDTSADPHRAKDPPRTKDDKERVQRKDAESDRRRPSGARMDHHRSETGAAPRRQLQPTARTAARRPASSPTEKRNTDSRGGPPSGRSSR